MKKLMGLLIAGVLMVASLVAGSPTAIADTELEERAEDIGGLCLVSPQSLDTIDHAAVTEHQQRWKRDIPGVEKVSHTEYRFYRDIPAVDKVERNLYRHYRDIPAQDETFTTKYRYSKVIPGTPGDTECEYKKKIKGSAEVKEYRWEAVFKKGKELKGIEVTSNRVCSKGDAGTWYLMPENVQPERFDGIAPTGNVNLSVYCTSYKDGLKGSTSVPYRYGETYKVYYPGPTASDWTENGSKPAAPSGSSWGDRIERVKTPATPDTWVTDWFVGNAPEGQGWERTDKPCRIKEGTGTADVTEWFPSEDGWTTEIKTAPWVQAAQKDFGNDDAVEGYRVWRDAAGNPTTVEADAAETETEIIEGWESEFLRTELVSEAVEGYREYLTADGTSRDRDDAFWFRDSFKKGWTVLETTEVITVHPQEGYTEFFVLNGEPTRTLGENNWTPDEDAPDQEIWTLVDEREFEISAAWTERVVIPAEYESCEEPQEPDEELSFTGPNPMSGAMAGAAALLVLVGGAILIGARHRKLN